jgi:hypothetical protein
VRPGEWWRNKSTGEIALVDELRKGWGGNDVYFLQLKQGVDRFRGIEFFSVESFSVGDRAISSKWEKMEEPPSISLSSPWIKPLAKYAKGYPGGMPPEKKPRPAGVLLEIWEAIKRQAPSPGK